MSKETNDKNIQAIRFMVKDREFSLVQLEKLFAKYPQSINETNVKELKKIKADIEHGKKFIENYENTGILFVDMTQNE